MSKHKNNLYQIKFNQDIHIARWLLIQVSFLIYYSSLVQVSQDRTIFMSVGKLVFLIMQLLLKLFDLSFHFLNMIPLFRPLFYHFLFQAEHISFLGIEHEVGTTVYSFTKLLMKIIAYLKPTWIYQLLQRALHQP